MGGAVRKLAKGRKPQKMGAEFNALQDKPVPNPAVEKPVATGQGRKATQESKARAGELRSRRRRGSRLLMNPNRRDRQLSDTLGQGNQL